MVGKTAPSSRANKNRMTRLRQYCGCLCSLLMGYPNIRSSVEHVTASGRRIGKGSEQHRWTIGLSEWHHFGVPWPGRTKNSMVELVGPSLAFGRKPFEAHFGSEESLVLVQDYMLELFERSPWAEYDVPVDVAMLVRRRWIEVNQPTAIG
jgi:hypothetical protein